MTDTKTSSKFTGRSLTLIYLKTDQLILLTEVEELRGKNASQ